MISTLYTNECLIRTKHYCLSVLAQFILKINIESKLNIISILQRRKQKHREISKPPKSMSAVVAESGLKHWQPAPEPTFYTSDGTFMEYVRNIQGTALDRP